MFFYTPTNHAPAAQYLKERPVRDRALFQVLKAGNNITTDDIMPSDSRLLPYRSNIPHLSNYCFELIDSEFPARCRENNGGINDNGLLR